MERLGARAIVFLALLLLATVVGPIACAAARRAVLVYRVRHRYRETTCTIRSSEVVVDSALRVITRPGGALRHHGTVYRPHIAYSYAVAGRELTSANLSPMSEPYADRAAAEAVLGRYLVGGQYRCWYDPRQPDQAFLER